MNPLNVTLSRYGGWDFKGFEDDVVRVIADNVRYLRGVLLDDLQNDLLIKQIYNSLNIFTIACTRCFYKTYLFSYSYSELLVGKQLMKLLGFVNYINNAKSSKLQLQTAALTL